MEEIMKVNILDAHDRMKHFVKQGFNIGECCQNLINQRPFGNHPFYIYAHARTEDDGINKRLIWQPRMTKPRMETNSMLFKGYPGKDTVKIIWILPARELWPEYEHGNLTQDKIVSDSIYNFRYHKKKMEASEPDDLSDEQIFAIYQEMKRKVPKLIS